MQTFTMNVPNEKDDSTVALRLIIPQGVKEISPNVKPGWTISLKKDGTGDDTKVTEIDWTGGSIPFGQRDEFSFSAQVPSKETTLQWDVYQVYQNGETIAWTHEPSKNPEDDSAPPPHSLTKVVNDLVGTAQSESNADVTSEMNALMFISSTALLLSLVAVGMQLTKQKNR